MKAPETARGKKVKCACGHAFRIPAKKKESAPKAARAQPPATARPKPPPRPKQEVVEDFEEVVDDFEEVDAYDEYDDYDELGAGGYDDYEDEPAALPSRRRKKSSSGKGRSKKQEGRGGVMGFLTGETALINALNDHEAETGEHYEFVKAGMPPLRLWLKNRKGDRWGLVRDNRGNELWVRYRVHLLSSPTLVFFD